MTAILADRLSAARRLRDIPAWTVAQRAGMPPSSLSNLESGRSLPSVDVLARLADALDVDADYLLGRTAEPTSRSENACKLASRISRLSEQDRRLTGMFLDTLEAQRRRDEETPLDRIRRRIEVVRSRQKTTD